MATALNKTRKRDSKLVIAAVLMAVFLSKPFFAAEGVPHELMEYVGYFLVALCAMGRVYTSAFLGGHKNMQLIDYGPFSVCRNPLYFFSLCGFSGICLMTGQLTIAVLASSAFCLIYTLLIRREEAFLLAHFGEAYADYLRRVPRLWPRPGGYRAPESVPMRPASLTRAFADNMGWFAALPLLELQEYLRHLIEIEPLFTLP